MKCKQIRIIGGGFGGLQVTYLKQEEKKGRVFTNEIREKRKQPIHLGLENRFKELRPFLLDLCKVLRGDEDKMTKDYIIQETEMTGLQIVIDTTADDGTGFILEGSSVVLGNKEQKYKTVKVESGDNYANFEAVQLIIKEIIKETEIYMRGDAKVSDEEILIRWTEKNNKDGEVDIESIKGMTPDEQKELLTKILEKAGACVIFNDEMTTDFDINDDLDEASEKIKEETYNLDDHTTTTIPLPNLTKEPILKKA